MTQNDFQKSALQGIERLSKKLDCQDKKIDSIKTMVTAQGTRLEVHEHRLGTAETKLGKLDDDFGDLADQTGKHYLAEVEAKLADLKGSRRHWFRWIIQAIAGIAIAVVSALVALKVGE